MCNKVKCMCPAKDCENHGDCEKCIKAHLGKKTPVFCMKETERK